MIDCKTSLQWMAVCRPSGEDLADPELAALAGHLEGCSACLESFRGQQLWDSRVGRAIRDVPLPAGLEERLLDRLAVQSASLAPADKARPAAPTIAPAPIVKIEAAPPSPAHRRRRPYALIFTAGLTAAAAAVLAFFLIGGRGTPAPRDPAELAQKIIDVFNDTELVLRSNAPHKILQWVHDTLDSDVALPTTLEPSRLAGCGRITLFDRQVPVIFYNSGRLEARVYVFSARQFGIRPSQLPLLALHTQNNAVWVWTEQDLTFVCVIPGVVDDPDRALDSFTRRSAGPLT